MYVPNQLYRGRIKTPLNAYNQSTIKEDVSKSYIMRQSARERKKASTCHLASGLISLLREAYKMTTTNFYKLTTLALSVLALYLASIIGRMF